VRERAYLCRMFSLVAGEKEGRTQLMRTESDEELTI